MGDGFAMFKGAVNVLDYVSIDYMALANYIQAFDKQIVKAENSPLNLAHKNFGINYEKVTGDGRIQIVENFEEPEKPAPAPATGDIDIVLYVTIGMIALAGGCLILKKKEQI